MADKAKTFDVWIVETNTYYRQVPYTVITDWAQQGRLLEEDKLRPSGTATWLTMAESPAFAAFMPHAEPFRADDEAEALEPVQVDFQWHQRRSQEDDDVDMIPLIDVSLVLLIFFMMTATVGGLSNFDTPQAEHVALIANPEMYWIGVDVGKPDGNGRRYTYSLGKGEAAPFEQFPDQVNHLAVVNRLTEELKNHKKPIDVRVRANRTLPCEIVIEDLTNALANLKRDKKIANMFIEVKGIQ